MEIGEGEIMREITPLERVDMLYGPKKVQRPTEEDQILDNFFAGVEESQKRKEEEEEIPMYGPFLEMSNEDLLKLMKEKPQIKLTPEQSFIKHFSLKDMCKRYMDSEPWSIQPLFKNLEQKKQEQRDNFEEVAKKLAEADALQDKTTGEYEEALETRQYRMLSKFYRPKTCAWFYRIVRNHGQDMVRYYSNHQPFNSDEKQEDMMRTWTYHKGMAKSWYKAARGYEEAMFNHFMFLKHKGETHEEYIFPPRDMEAIEDAKISARQTLTKTFFINLDELEI